MSRMSELSGCIADLKAAAAALISAAETLTELYSGEEPAQDRPESRPITKEEVRAELAAKATAGYGAQVRALLKRYGAAQLSAVKAEDYASLLLAAQAAGVQSCWINFFDPEAAAKAFDLPENEEVLMLLDLGYAAPGAGPLPAHSQRKPLSETVRYL